MTRLQASLAGLLAALASGIPSAFGSGPTPVPTPTQAQMDAIDSKIANAPVSGKAASLWKSAGDTIRTVTQALSCYPGPDVPGALLRYVAPGNEQVYSFVFKHGVMDRGYYGRFHYHPKTLCTTVNRVDSVTAKAKNALSYRVVYVSDESGETFTATYTMMRQPDGVWLYTLE